MAEEITQLLAQWGRGEAGALDRLMPLVYDELRKLARHYLQQQGPNRTLQPTAIVNEAYLRLVKHQQVDFQNRAQFYGLAAKLIRELLVDDTRRRLAGKRGFHQCLYQIGFVRGDTPLLEEQISWARGKPDEAQALDWQAQTAAFGGRLGTARAFSERAAAIARQRNLPEAAAVLALEAALRQALLGDERQTKGDLARAVARAPSGSLRGGRGNALLLMGPLALALSGDVRQAQSLSEEVARQNHNNLLMEVVGLPVVRAAIALRSNRPEQALDLLEPARAYEAGAEFWPTYLRGQAYLDARRGAEAAAEFQKIIDHRGWDPTSVLWPLAHLGLARAAVLNGDAAQARQSYEAFLALWREADADLPLLVAARREAEKLK